MSPHRDYSLQPFCKLRILWREFSYVLPLLRHQRDFLSRAWSVHCSTLIFFFECTGSTHHFCMLVNVNSCPQNMKCLVQKFAIWNTLYLFWSKQTLVLWCRPWLEATFSHLQFCSDQTENAEGALQARWVWTRPSAATAEKQSKQIFNKARQRKQNGSWP